MLRFILTGFSHLAILLAMGYFAPIWSIVAFFLVGLVYRYYQGRKEDREIEYQKRIMRHP